MQSKAHWPVFMREQGNVNLNATFVAQPLSLAILLPLLTSPLLLHGGNPCWHKAQRTKCWLHLPAAGLSPLPTPALILYSQAVRLQSRMLCLWDCNCISHLWNISLAALLLLRPLYPFLLLLGQFIQGAHQHRASAPRRHFVSCWKLVGIFFTIWSIYVAGGRSCFLFFPIFVSLSLFTLLHTTIPTGKQDNRLNRTCFIYEVVQFQSRMSFLWDRDVHILR